MKDRTGEINYNSLGSKIIIKEYRGCLDVDVYFPEYNYTKEHVRYDNFKKGSIKCVYEPRVYKVGYTGEGKYKVNENGRNTKCYSVWNGMLQRAYDSKYIQKYPTYTGCEVSEKWHNFQVFAEWYYDNFYQIEGEQMTLDKDIMCKGNKIYSPETCVIVPQTINKLFTKSDKCRGDLPIGVIYHNKKYEAQCNVNGKPKHLGSYNTPEEAFYVYKNFKEQHIKKVAEEYKDKIHSKLYKAMINYKVEIDD